MFKFPNLKDKRLQSVIAATVISLACGTNYAYSAWAPQFAQRLKLSSTQSNLIGTAGNLGMYASGVPVGMLVDAKGPRWGIAFGTLCFAVGYYPIAMAYDAGPNAYSVAILCFFSFLTGTGSAAAFSGSIKTSALNYPETRGTATAFPLAAFGLSAFFFSSISALFMSDSTFGFLVLLAAGTVLLPTISFYFIQVFPVNPYHSVLQSERQALHRTSQPEPRRTSYEPPTQHPPKSPTKTRASESSLIDTTDDETSSLLSIPEDLEASVSRDDPIHEPATLDIRGIALLPHAQFWQLFSMLGLLTGIGLMTINNIGNDAQALWLHYDPTTSPAFIQSRQSMHVSILSLGSFTGRLLSGIGSDYLVSQLNRSRFWCLLTSASIFTLAQFLGTAISSPHILALLSGTTGLGYGMLFGVYPSLVAHAFGVNGLSQNWGTMTLAPVISGNIFNLLYGHIFDANSVRDANSGDLQCFKGVECYRTAYWVTFFAAVVGIALCGWSIWHENMVHRGKMRVEKGRKDHERVA